METLKLWDSVCKTDPKYTKEFNRAGGFSGTAINATYLIRKATEQWGPVGSKWGWKVLDEKYVPGHEGTIVHVLRIELRHPDGAFESYGQTTFCGKNKNGPYTDEEAPKKSLTDAITKALAMLGFSADVHLGLYDDNKYVNTLKAEFAKPAAIKQGPGAITPTTGAWDELDADTQKRLQMIADCVLAEMDSKGAKEAAALLAENTHDMPNEEKVGLWTRLDSKTRSAIKKANDERKAA